MAVWPCKHSLQEQTGMLSSCLPMWSLYCEKFGKKILSDAHTISDSSQTKMHALESAQKNSSIGVGWRFAVSDSSITLCLVHGNIAFLPPTCNPACKCNLLSASQCGFCLACALKTELEQCQFLFPSCVVFARPIGTKSSKICTDTILNTVR